MAEVFKNSKYFSAVLLSVFGEKFIHWDVSLVSVTRSREVSAILRLLCTGNDSGPRPFVRIVEVSVIWRVRFRRFHCTHL